MQPIPAGWTGSYGMLAGKNKRGWLDYTTTCTCRNEKGKVVKGRVDIPHKIRNWAKEHGDHR